MIHRLIKISSQTNDSHTSQLLLIDLKDHRRGGHFGPWLKWFAQEFSTRFDLVRIITPKPKNTKSLFSKDERRCFKFNKLSKKHRTALPLDELCDSYNTKGQSTSCFIMWGPDLNKRRIPEKLPPWATVIGLSISRRHPELKEAVEEHETLQIVESSHNCRGFFQADHFLKNIPNKAVWLPDLENIELLNTRSELVTKIQAFRSDTFTVGVFGILAGPRCLHALVELAREHPNIRFVLVGKLLSKRINKSATQFLEENPHRNLFLHAGFIEKEEELNSAIDCVDAVLIDGSHYPQHSGVVSKAIYMGKCILSPDSNSWTCELIKAEGVGIAYESAKLDLLKEWKIWHSNNGPQRSRETSRQLRRLDSVKASFDTITHQLTK